MSYLHIYSYIYLSIFSSIYPLTFLLIYLFICIFISLFIALFLFRYSSLYSYIIKKSHCAYFNGNGGRGRTHYPTCLASEIRIYARIRFGIGIRIKPNWKRDSHCGMQYGESLFRCIYHANSACVSVRVCVARCLCNAESERMCGANFRVLINISNTTKSATNFGRVR